MTGWKAGPPSRSPFHHGLLGLAVLVFRIMGLHLVWRMGKAFREHGAYASAIWAQQQSMPPTGEVSSA